MEIWVPAYLLCVSDVQQKVMRRQRKSVRAGVLFCVCVCVCACSDLISFSPLVWITCRICLGVMGASEKFSKTWRRKRWLKIKMNPFVTSKRSSHFYLIPHKCLPAACFRLAAADFRSEPL